MKIHSKFRKLHAIKRHRHHPLIHRIHRKHRISYSTIFYMKEYGKRSHAVLTIVKESLRVVILAAIISSAGGLGLENIRGKFIALLPLLIMIPALNDMIGDFGTIVSSKFTTMIYTRKVRLGKVLQSKEFKSLMKTVFAVAFVSSLYLGLVSYAIAYYRGFPFSVAALLKVLGIAMASTLLLVSIVSAVSVIFGIRVYRRKEDPNNFLIPISTAIADLGSMAVFSAMVLALF